MPRDPLALRRGLDENARWRSIAERRGEALPTCHHAAFADRAVISDGAELALALVQIKPYRIHGGWPPDVVPRLATMSTF